MVREENFVSKRLYKLFLIAIKVIPYMITAAYILYTFCSFYDVELTIIGYLASCSLLTWSFLYFSSFVFRFCIYHRIPLYYIATSDLINIADTWIGIPISTYAMLMVQYAALGLFILLFIYFKRKYAESFKRFASWDC